jgi:hypothetical protein
MYRIRWAYVSGPWQGTRRMCMAERRVRLLGIVPVWWPVDGEWRWTEADAENDIDDDLRHRQPLPPARIVAR